MSSSFVPLILLAALLSINAEQEIMKIAFGSCSKQFMDQPLWKHIESFNPDLWIWLGKSNSPLQTYFKGMRSITISNNFLLTQSRTVPLPRLM
jgi:hypothetical protein